MTPDWIDSLNVDELRRTVRRVIADRDNERGRADKLQQRLAELEGASETQWAIKCSKLERQRDAMHVEILRLLGESNRLRGDWLFAEQMSKAFGDSNKELVVENIKLRQRWMSVPFAAIRAAFLSTGDEIIGAWLGTMAKPDSIADGPTANMLDSGA